MEMWEQIGRVFLAYGTLLIAVPSFKYLGRIMSFTDNDWPAVEQNLRRAWGKWGQMVKILGREGLDRRMVEDYMWWW